MSSTSPHIAKRADKVVYRIQLSRVESARFARIRRLQRARSNGARSVMSVSGWFSAFLEQTEQREENRLRELGIPIPRDDGPEVEPSPFRGLPDDAPIVDE